MSSTRAVGTLLSLALLGSTAFAQNWPSKPIRILVPFAAGGNTDSIARVTGEALARKLGTPVIVENRPGANGALAAEAVMRAPADGYTLFMATAPQMAILPQLTKTRYDPVKDFEPISIIASNVFALTVGSGSPAKNVADFVAAAKAQPGKMSYASAGNGSVSHLSMAMFAQRAQLDMVHVTYKGGAPALADVIAGHMPVYFANVPEVLPQVSGGRIRLLAVSSKSRLPQLPDVPTLAESGYAGFQSATWNGLSAPAQTPKAIVERVAGELAALSKEPDFVKKMESLGVQVVCNTPTEFAAQLREDMGVWGQAIKTSGAKLE
jgi:tripartite-type tricarboxylate transporter receptor subunit TctC